MESEKYSSRESSKLVTRSKLSLRFTRRSSGYGKKGSVASGMVII